MADTNKTPGSYNNGLRSKPSAQSLSWLNSYFLAVIRQEDSIADFALSANLKPRLARLEIEAEGDYATQIDRLYAEAPAGGSRLSLADISANNRGNILLGKTGSGKTRQLRDLTLRQSRSSLAQVEQLRAHADATRTAETPLLLPVYLQLPAVAASMAELEKAGNKANLFQAALEAHLSQLAGSPVPPTLLNEVVPVVLADNLELLEPALAPIFLSRFNIWFTSIAPEARVIISCQHLSFMLYHPWFRPEQQWQFHGLCGFDWSEVRPALSGRYSEIELSQLELTGLTGLFVHPALCKLFTSTVSSNQTGLAGLLNSFINGILQSKTETALQLARFSQFLGDEFISATPVNPVQPKGTTNQPQASGYWGSHFTLQAKSQVAASHSQPQVLPKTIETAPAAADPALMAALIEKHPVADWTRLVNPALDRLLAGWYCLQLDPAILPGVLDRVIGESSQQGEGQLNFLKLLYLLTAPEALPALFSGLLGQPPTMERLHKLITVVRVDPAAQDTWHVYLSGLANGSDQTFSRQVLELVAQAGKYEPDGEQPVNLELVGLAEIALELLSQVGPADAALYLELGHAQEQLALLDKALVSYDKANQSSSLPALEGTLGVARLRAEQGSYDEASTTLTGLGQKLVYFQSEIANQLSVIKRKQHEFETSLEYARQAVQLGKRPVYRHNLALALSEKGSRTEAEQELQKLTQDFPNFADGFYDLGRIQSERGASEQALANLRRAVELSSTTARYLYDLGRSLLAQGRLEEACTYLKASVAQGNNQPDYQVALGLVSLKLARLDEARTAFARSIELAGDKLRADQLVYLAAADFASANYNEAQRSLNRALNLEPQRPALLLLSALVAEADNRFDLALAQYRKATVYGDEQSQVPAALRLAWNLGLARDLRLSNRLEEAARHSQAASRLEPGSPESLFEEGQVSLARRNTQEAAVFFGRGVTALGMLENTKEDLTGSLYPSDAGWLNLFTIPGKLQFELPYQYAVSLRELGQFDQSQKVLREQLQKLEQLPVQPLTELGTALLSVRRAAFNYELGLCLMEIGSNQEGQQHLTRAVTEAPATALYRLGLAKALLKNGQTERAIFELNQARELDATLAEVYAELAEIPLSVKSKAPDKTLMLGSLTLYLKALDYAPNNQTYLYRAALLAYHLRHQNHATELIRRLLQLAPNMPAAHLLLACNLERSGNLAKAREEIALALAKGGKTPDYYAVAVRLARRANALQEMEQLLTVLRGQPNLPLYLQAAIKTEEGQLALAQEKYFPAGEAYHEAIDAFEKFTATDEAIPLEELYYESGAVTGGSAYGQSLLANYKVAYAGVLRHLKQHDKALIELDEALVMQPQLAQGHILRGDLLVQQGQLREALKSRQRAAELEPTPLRLYELGQVYLKLDEIEPAIDALKQAETSKEITGKSEYWASLGLAYQKAGNHTGARAAYKRGLQLNPNDPELQKALAESYLTAGERLAAVQHLQGAVVSQPGNPEYRLELAQLYEDLGWYQEANSEYEETTNLNPTAPKAWLQRGKALNKTGQSEQARSSLEQALRLDENLAEAHYEIGLLYLRAYQAKHAQTDKLPPDLRGMFTSSQPEMAAR
jgi:tetratricopeptide (TPR) repeat protein